MKCHWYKGYFIPVCCTSVHQGYCSCDSDKIKKDEIEELKKRISKLEKIIYDRQKIDYQIYMTAKLIKTELFSGEEIFSKGISGDNIAELESIAKQAAIYENGKIAHAILSNKFIRVSKEIIIKTEKHKIVVKNISNDTN